MRPAVEATNRLLARIADALQTERSFTSNSAHELRTPIAGALAQAQLLAGTAETAATRERADALVQALTRLARLAERLLALARAEGGTPLATHTVDLGVVVQLLARECEHEARARGCRLVTAGEPARVRGDLDAIGLAVRNLLENAFVHAGAGATIRLTCGTAGGRARIRGAQR